MTATVYRGPHRKCVRCRNRASVQTHVGLVCWEHYNETLKR